MEFFVGNAALPYGRASDTLANEALLKAATASRSKVLISPRAVSSGSCNGARTAPTVSKGYFRHRNSFVGNAALTYSRASDTFANGALLKAATASRSKVSISPRAVSSGSCSGARTAPPV